MSAALPANLIPWAILAALLVVVLAAKGWIKIPGRPASKPPFKPECSTSAGSNPAPVSGVTHGEATPSEAFLLERLDSHTLGVYFALAARREAEAKIATNVAIDAGKAIEEKFTAPFVKAATPAPPEGRDG